MVHEGIANESLEQENGMAQEPLHLSNYFSAADEEAWREAAHKVLKGKPLESLQRRRWEGFTSEPFYVGTELPAYLQAPPDHPPFARGAHSAQKRDGWELRQVYEAGSIDQASQALQKDAAQGVSSHWIIPSTAAQRGLPCDTVEAFSSMISGLQLDQVPVWIEAGAMGRPLLGQWVAAAQAAGVAPAQLTGGVLCDPLSTLAATGALPASLASAWDDQAEVCKWVEARARSCHAAVVSGLPAHDAGAHAAQELGYVIAALTEHLRAMATRGVTPESFTAHAHLRIGVGRDMFTEIAKVRALRVLVCKVLQACGLKEDQLQLAIHSVALRVTASQRDKWVNLLRATAECFSAAVGGADAITLMPFDRLLGTPSDLARRQAANTQLVLAKESYLSQVEDPAGGAWYIETLTDQLARGGWSFFQSIEAEGGLTQALRNGSVQEAFAQVTADKERAIAKRKAPVLGVSEYANPEDLLQEEASPQISSAPSAEIPSMSPNTSIDQLIEVAKQGHTTAALFHALHPDAAKEQLQALEGFRWAASWEALRDAADRHTQSHPRPTLFLSNIGPIPAHKARAAFTQRLLEAGGIATLTNEGFTTPEAAIEAYASSGADGAVICGKDDDYLEWVEPLAKGLQAKGARDVVVAGRMGTHEASWREAGVTHAIYMGCDALGTLKELLTRVGVEQ